MPERSSTFSVAARRDSARSALLDTSRQVDQSVGTAWANIDVARIVLFMPKAELLDPQGKAVAGALTRLGYDGFEGVRIGKRFELTVADASDETLAAAPGVYVAGDVARWPNALTPTR